MTVDPRTPVIIGVAQRNGDGADCEPIATMVDVARDADVDAGNGLSSVQEVRVVQGIWPYADPGRLVAAELGLHGVSTALTQIGGNEVFDLLAETAGAIQRGELDSALLVSAETMRTRRRDRAAGRSSAYRPEADDAAPSRTFGSGPDLVDQVDIAAGTHHAAHFYAMAETALRHRRGETVRAHADRIAALWARASDVAATNPHAWLRDAQTPESVGTPSETNRMIASPYPKLMTSNINVDQAAAALVCSYEHARSLGVAADRLVFVHAGTGAHDTWVTRNRLELDASPAMRVAGRAALRLAGTSLAEIEHIDLYSCFPSSVQVGQVELGLEADRPFTITGGLTFAGGPFNSYCMHSLARAVELLRGSDRQALLNGNGGFFTKHSYLVLGGAPAPTGFRSERPQAEIDAHASRPPTTEVPERGRLETYTVLFDRDGTAERAILAVLDRYGSRTWAQSSETEFLQYLLDNDAVEETVDLRPGSPPSAILV